MCDGCCFKVGFVVRFPHVACSPHERRQVLQLCIAQICTAHVCSGSGLLTHDIPIRNKKLLVTSATLVVTGALLVVTMFATTSKWMWYFQDPVVPSEKVGLGWVFLAGPVVPYLRRYDWIPRVSYIFRFSHKDNQSPQKKESNCCSGIGIYR